MQLLGTGKQRAGKTSRVLVGGVGLTFSSWAADLSGDDLDTVNFESYSVAAGQTYDEGILGVLGCKFNFGGDYDAGTSPLGSPPGLFPRDDLAALSFDTVRTDAGNNLWSFTYARLRTANNSASVRGKVAFACTGMNQGSFVYPTASV